MLMILTVTMIWILIWFVPSLIENYESVESLREATVEAMENLIRGHQQIPGNISRAVKERMDLVENPFVEHYDFVVKKMALCYNNLTKL